MRPQVQVCLAAARLSVCGLVLFSLQTLTASAQTQVTPGAVIISEVRFRGPAGPSDEFIEFYNNTDADIVVRSVDGSQGWGVATSDGVVRFFIPDGTLIPARGHLLAANSSPGGYSLGGYAAGNPVPPDGEEEQTQPFGAAEPDISYAGDIPDGLGVALFLSSRPANQTFANRLDAFGFVGNDERFREGAGWPSAPTAGGETSFVRDMSGGRPADTNANASDFIFVSTTPGATGGLLGAPGPENLSSPVTREGDFAVAPLDPSVSTAQAPNRERRPNVVPNGNLGTLVFRRTFTNNTALPVTRLRFRVVNLTTLGTEQACGRQACSDLRALTSPDGESGSPNIGVVTVRGVRLEEPPAQPNGGGFNSSLSAEFVTLAAPLLPGQSVNIQFVLGVMRTGPFRFYFNVEGLTAAEPVVVAPRPAPLPPPGARALR